MRDPGQLSDSRSNCIADIRPSSGIAAAYETSQDLNTAQGLYMMVWFVFTVIMTLGAVRCSVGLFLVCEFDSRCRF